MPKWADIKKILVIGFEPIVVPQVHEVDDSGAQSVKQQVTAW